jgi:hypothetical protein
MACELARYKIPVRVVDKAAHRTDKSKAIVLWSRGRRGSRRHGFSEEPLPLRADAAAIRHRTAGNQYGHVHRVSPLFARAAAECRLGRTLELLDRGPGTSRPFLEAGFKVHHVNFIKNDACLRSVSGRWASPSNETPRSRP